MSETESDNADDSDDYMPTEDPPAPVVAVVPASAGVFLDGDDPLRIEKILAFRTMPAARWKTVLSAMNTKDIVNGSMFIDETGSAVEHKDRYLVKWAGLSFVHVSWETPGDLQQLTINGKRLIKTFEAALAEGLASDNDDVSEYTAIERIVDYQVVEEEAEEVDEDDEEAFAKMLEAQETDEAAGASGPKKTEWLLVKWNGLPYSDCTWEIRADANDDKAIERYLMHHREEPKTGRKHHKQRAEMAKDFVQLTESPVFKNGGSLRSYQVDSLNWLIFNWLQGRNSLLADEMGLGKTLQSASFCQHLYTHCNLAGPTMIVAPLSTLQHWQREFSSWTDLNAIIFHGDKDSRAEIRNSEFFQQCDLKQVEYHGSLLMKKDLKEEVLARLLVGKAIRKFVPERGCYVTGTIQRTVAPGTDGSVFKNKGKNKKEKAKKKKKKKKSKAGPYVYECHSSSEPMIPLSKAVCAKLIEGIDKIRSMEIADLFNEAVDIDGYTDIVPHPIDLGTIHQQLQAAAASAAAAASGSARSGYGYKCLGEVREDFQRLHDNCGA
jgi:hypothetical protein